MKENIEKWWWQRRWRFIHVHGPTSKTMNKASNSVWREKIRGNSILDLFIDSQYEMPAERKKREEEENRNWKGKLNRMSTRMCVWCSVIGKVLAVGLNTGCWLHGIHMCGSKCLYFSFHHWNCWLFYSVMHFDWIYQFTNNMISIHLS